MGLNVSILRQSFAIAKPMLPDIIASFYEILFREYPEIKVVFAKTEHGMLHKALASAFVNIVDNLDKQDKLSSYLMNLGSRHIGYGVKPAYFEWFGSSLLKSLEAFFGDEWQGDFSREWSACISMVLDMVRQGAGLSNPAVPPALEIKPIVKSQPVISPKIEPPPPSIGKTMENKSTKTYQVTLTEDVKASIKKAVKQAIDEAIKNEIAKALESELKNINESDLAAFFTKSA